MSCRLYDRYFPGQISGHSDDGSDVSRITDNARESPFDHKDGVSFEEAQAERCATLTLFGNR